MKTRHSLFIFLFLLTLSSSAQAGSVTGTIRFKGTPPAPQKIDMNSDPSCGAQAGSKNETEEAVVGADGSLKNVFVYVKQGLEGKTFEAPKQNVLLDQKGCRYQPHVLGLQVGQTLEILNSDSTLHNVHGMPAAGKPFNLGMPIQGMKIKRKFDKPEIMVKFKCDVHPWMSAFIGVLPHPFFAVSAENGSFEIKDLPPGTYTLEAWHEKFGTQTQQVVVDASGAKTADFSFSG